MAKLLKLRRGNTQQHGSFTGAEGEVTVDTDKDTLVVHDGSQVGGRPLLREDMSNLPAGTIDNADVNASAAIAGTKISPDFGSQNITTTGDTTVAGTLLANGRLSTNNDYSYFQSNSTSNASLTLKKSASGADSIDYLQCRDSNNALKFKIGGNGNIDIVNGIDVTGDITVTGTVDGADVAAMNTTLASLSSVNGSLANGVTATTQSASDNSTKVATTAYTDTAISNLVDSSPAALNTLNELAAALGDDANFSTTVNNNIAAKMPTGGGTFVGDVKFQSSVTGKDIEFDRSEAKIIWEDNAEATFGDDDDLTILHNGTNTKITNTSGELLIGGNHVEIRNGDQNSTRLAATSAGALELYFSNNKKLETTNTGVSVTGALVASGDVTAFSDQTLKKDITTINDALGLCGKLRGVSYKWIKDDKPSIGVIAQEIEQHIPEIVSTTQLDGKDVKSVDYGKIVGVLINAVNELKAELDEYKDKYKELTTKEYGNFTEDQRNELTFLVKKES